MFDDEWKRFGPFCCGFFAHFAAVVEGLRRWMAFASFSFVRPFPSTDCDESLAASKWNSLEAFIGSPYSFAVEFSGLNELPCSLWPKKFLAENFIASFNVKFYRFLHLKKLQILFPGPNVRNVFRIFSISNKFVKLCRCLFWMTVGSKKFIYVLPFGKPKFSHF